MSTQGDKIQKAAEAKTGLQPLKEFEVGGKKVAIFPGKTYHVEKAMAVLGIDTAKANAKDFKELEFLRAYMAQTITIDGKAKTFEELSQWDGFEYLQILGEFRKVNFTSSRKK